MKFLFGLLTSLPDLIKGLFGYLNKKQDTVAIQSTNSKDVSTAIVQSETARYENVKDITLVMMSHPIFWVAWGLGVFPVLLYHSMIFFVSTFPHLWLWLTHIPANKAVLAVPAEEIEFGKTVIGSVFVLTGASSVVAGIASAWLKRT